MKPWQLTDEERGAAIALAVREGKDTHAQVADAAGRKAALWAAGIAAGKWPRGSAHTYASENGDRYVALEDASEAIAKVIRKELE